MAAPGVATVRRAAERLPGWLSGGPELERPLRRLDAEPQAARPVPRLDAGRPAASPSVDCRRRGLLVWIEPLPSVGLWAVAALLAAAVGLWEAASRRCAAPVAAAARPDAVPSPVALGLGEPSAVAPGLGVPAAAAPVLDAVPSALAPGLGEPSAVAPGPDGVAHDAAAAAFPQAATRRRFRAAPQSSRWRWTWRGVAATEVIGLATNRMRVGWRQPPSASGRERKCCVNGCVVSRGQCLAGSPTSGRCKAARFRNG